MAAKYNIDLNPEYSFNRIAYVIYFDDECEISVNFVNDKTGTEIGAILQMKKINNYWRVYGIKNAAHVLNLLGT